MAAQVRLDHPLTKLSEGAQIMPRITGFTMLVACSLLVLAPAANAACSDRPGTPDQLSAYPSTTSISLSWRNRAKEGYAPTSPLGYSPFTYYVTLPVNAAYHEAMRGRIYFDIFVREGSPGGRPVGQDRIGYGPFESFPDSHRLGTPFTGLAPGTTYCFAMRARTEAGTQGCVSRHQSEWVCATTAVVPPPPPSPVPNASPEVFRNGTSGSVAIARPAPVPDYSSGVLRNGSAGSAATTPTPPAAVTDITRHGATRNAAAAAAIPIACKSGYVWRAARPTDVVCVEPWSNALVKRENRKAKLQLMPGGGNTCIPGLVWREAFDGDAVCVTPTRRAEVRQENLLAASRVR
jgi:hypothetical protein